MPNPGAMTSLQAFDREIVNTVIHVPDYRLRQRLALQKSEPLVVEAFIAFDEMFYLHLRWTEDCNYPEILLSSVGARYHKLVLDLSVQSPHFTYVLYSGGSEGPGSPGARGGLHGAVTQPWSLCTWATPTRPVEVRRPSSVVPLQADKPPTYHNDINISLDQTVTFTLTGTIWELDDNAISSLHCKSYRAGIWEAEKPKPLNTVSHMTANVAAMRDSLEVPTDIKFQLEEGGDAGGAHSFVLQSQSPVFRRMLAVPMTESKDRVIKMAGVSPAELDDMLGAVYLFGVPPEVKEDVNRLLGLMALADRYELIAIRDECAVCLQLRLTEANMATFLKVADMHQAAGLRTAALEFITSRIERIAAAMDSDDPSVRRSVREHLSVAEELYKRHTAAAELKATEVTLTV